MENNSQDKKQKHSPEHLADLMEEIDSEISDIKDFIIPEESIIDDMVSGGEEESIELDPELFEEDDLEMELETGEDPTGSSTEIESVEVDSETDTNTSVDGKGTGDELLAEKEAVSSDAEEVTMSGINNDLASIMTKKIEEVVARFIEERMYTTGKQSSKNFFTGTEEVTGLERKLDVYSEKSYLNPSTDELADLMSNRIERIVSRKVEEQMPVIAERIVLEMVKKILMSVE